MSTTILQNGHRTLITIAGLTASFEEVSVNPPGMKADDPVEQTNMRASNYRTFLGGSLLTMTEMTLKVHYGVAVYTQILPILRQNRLVTIRFFDGSTVSVYCIITSFTPEELQINEKPTATLVLTPSNMSTSNPPGEIGIVYATGTTTTVAP